MAITSLGYLVLILSGMVLYYLLPGTWQWVELLVVSLIFYFMAGEPGTVICLVLSTAVAYVSTVLTASNVGNAERRGRGATVVGILAVLINIILWFALKATDLWFPFVRQIGRIVPYADKVIEWKFVSALGMGYYTLQVIGYILDCYWGNVKPQKNPLKLFLFVCFFPQMITGPISRYSQLESLYERHSFSYDNLSFGAQRILWGFFKKLVLAERVGTIVNGVWGNLNSYVGFYRWIALLLFPVQMYADFSGCMDIVIGTAELFGIRLQENFNSPFFSKTVQEFWQRWHITLGTWAKDYVLYPTLKSRLMVSISRMAKMRFGKKRGKFVATAVGMLVLWLIMGVWHGAYKYVIGVSLWYWALLMLGEACAPGLKRLSVYLKISQDSFSWHFFQSIRTYFIYAVGAVFFRAPSIREGGEFLLSLKQVIEQDSNPWIFFDGSILGMGVTYCDINIIIISICLLVAVGVLREKYGYARTWVKQQILIFRWLVWIGLLVFVVIYGKYGPGYRVEDFIYQGF